MCGKFSFYTKERKQLLIRISFVPRTTKLVLINVRCNDWRGLKNWFSIFSAMDRKDTVSDITASVKIEAIKHLIKLQFKDPKTRIGDDTVRLVGELVQLLIVEAAARSCNQAILTSSSTVEMEHVERILPKLLLDF